MKFLKKLWESKSVIFDSIGYDNLRDFSLTIFGIKEKNIIPIISIAIVAVFNLVNEVIEGYIYDPALGIFILFFLTCADMLTGISKTIKRGENLEPNRISRATVRFSMQVFVVFILTQMSSIWGVFINQTVIDIVLISFILSVFWSFIKNAHEIKWLNRETFLLLQNALDINRLYEIVDEMKQLFKTRNNDDDKNQR